MAKNRLSGKLAVILHADIAGSTELVQQDEWLTHESIQDTFQRFGDTIENYQGRQSGDEVQWFKGHVSSAISIRRF